MKGYVFCSTIRGAGKTTVIAGLAQALGPERVGYFKPLGDHLVYKEKTVWDMDGALMGCILHPDRPPGDLTFGFDRSKLRYMHSEEELGKRLTKRFEELSKGTEYFFVEGAGTPEAGHSLGMNAVALSRLYDLPVVAVLRGDEASVLDEASFIRDFSRIGGVNFKGVIINGVHDVSGFRHNVMDEMEAMDVNVLGILQHKEPLTVASVKLIVERLYAKVIAGEDGLDRSCSQIFVGAMAASHARRHPGWKDPRKLIITAGDRDDLIAAAIEDGAGCLVITNDLVPSPTILAKADLAGVPILQVPTDTYSTAKKLENLENTILPHESDKLEAAREMVEEAKLHERLA